MESLKIQVDFTTSEAVTATQVFVTELGTLNEKVQQSDASVTQAEKSVRDLGQQLGAAASQAGEAAEAFDQVSEASRAAAQSSTVQADAAENAIVPISGLTQASSQGAAAAGAYAAHLNQMNVQINNVNNVANTTVTNINNVAGATRNVGAATSGLAGQVQAWLSTYIGIYGVIEIFQKFLDKLREVKEAQDELTAGRLSFDDKLNNTIATLGLGGSSTAQATVIKLLRDLSLAAPVNQDQGLAALDIAQSFGHDPRTAEGMKYAAQVGYAEARLGMDKDTITNIARLANSTGNNTAQGFADVIAKAEAGFRVSGSATMGDYVRGLVSAVLPEVGKGVDLNRAAGVYSAFLQTRAGEDAAADATKQTYAFAQGTTKESREYFAHRAAQMGVTKVTDAQDADAEAVLGADKSSAGRAFRSDQKKLADIEDKEKEAYVRGMWHGASR